MALPVRYISEKSEVPTVMGDVSRNSPAKMQTEAFEIPASFDFHKLTGSHFGVHWSEDEFKVKIRFNKAVAGYLKEGKWYPSQKIEEIPDGSVILSLTVNHLLELKRWILSWGNMAEVLEPKSFVENFEKTIDEMRSIYR